MKFRKGKDAKKATNIGRTVLDDLKKHPICQSMNDPKKDVDFRKDSNFSVWINPRNQFCFNSMRCSSEILKQWMMGTGPMVRGKTNAEKKIYWDYAVFENEKDPWGINHSKYLIKYYWNHFDKMTTDFNPHAHSSNLGIDRKIKKPLKLRNNKTSDHLENKIRTEEAIISMLAPYVNHIVKEFEYREWQNIRREVDQEFYGIKRTLYCLGYGFMGASNIPQEFSNLSWVTDVVYAKAIYIWLKKHETETNPLPDFDFLSHPNRDKFIFEEK